MVLVSRVSLERLRGHLSRWGVVVVNGVVLVKGCWGVLWVLGGVL